MMPEKQHVTQSAWPVFHVAILCAPCTSPRGGPVGTHFCSMSPVSQNGVFPKQVRQ